MNKEVRMTSKNIRKTHETKQSNIKKGKPCVINVKKIENECSTDEQAIKCCSLKNMRSMLPELIKTKTECKQIVLSTKDLNNNTLQIYEIQNKAEYIKQKKCLIKNEEYMYDLAHFLYKISDLLLQVSEYEKRKSVKEDDLKKMLNIVKTEIMRSFLKGKTKRVTMNKIVTRLIYLDKYIQQLNDDVLFDIEHQNINDVSSKKQQSSNENTKINPNINVIKINKIPPTYQYNYTAITNNNEKISISNHSLSSSVNYHTVIPSTSINQENNQNILSENKNQTKYTEENKNENVQTVILKHKDMCSKITVCSKCHDRKSTENCCKKTQSQCSKLKQFLTKKQSQIRELLKLIDQCTQTETYTATKDCSTLPPLKKLSATTSYEEFYYNPDGPFPKINANLLYKKRHLPILPHIPEIGCKEINETLINKLHKQISAQKLKNSNLNSIQVEGNMQTDDLLLTEAGDFQIISMNVLYSKTHVRYIVPKWMQVDYDIDQTPKVLCKQDLDDGIALTSYKVDQDGTIHFTLAFSSDELCNLTQQHTASGQLITKLQDIRGIWAESARLLYDTLTKQYEEQSLPIKDDSEENRNNVEDSFDEPSMKNNSFANSSTM